MVQQFFPGPGDEDEEDIPEGASGEPPIEEEGTEEEEE